MTFRKAVLQMMRLNNHHVSAKLAEETPIFIKDDKDHIWPVDSIEFDEANDRYVIYTK